MVVLGETNIFCGGTLYKKFGNHSSRRRSSILGKPPHLCFCCHGFCYAYLMIVGIILSQRGFRLACLLGFRLGSLHTPGYGIVILIVNIV